MNTQQRLNRLIGRIEAHIYALSVAAAQAQMTMRPESQNKCGWSDEFDTMARNLAEPALEETARLRAILGCPRVVATPEEQSA
jgi:hypothetical protein